MLRIECIENIEVLKNIKLNISCIRKNFIIIVGYVHQQNKLLMEFKILHIGNFSKF